MKKITFLLGLVILVFAISCSSKDVTPSPNEVLFISDKDFVINQKNYTIFNDVTNDGIENYVWSFGPHSMNTISTYNKINGTIQSINEINSLTTTTVLNSNKGLMNCLSYQGNPLTLDFRVKGQLTTIINVSSGTNPPSYMVRKVIEEYTIMP